MSGGKFPHLAESYFSLSVWLMWALLVVKEQHEINTEMGRTLALILLFCVQSLCQSSKLSLPSIPCISSLAEFLDTVAFFLFSLLLSFFLRHFVSFFHSFKYIYLYTFMFVCVCFRLEGRLCTFFVPFSLEVT